MLFFKNHAENQPGTLVPDQFLFLKKVLYDLKASGLQLSFIIVVNYKNTRQYNKNIYKI